MCIVHCAFCSNIFSSFIDVWHLFFFARRQICSKSQLIIWNRNGNNSAPTRTKTNNPFLHAKCTGMKGQCNGNWMGVKVTGRQYFVYEHNQNHWMKKRSERMAEHLNRTGRLNWIDDNILINVRIEWRMVRHGVTMNLQIERKWKFQWFKTRIDEIIVWMSVTSGGRHRSQYSYMHTVRAQML